MQKKKTPLHLQTASQHFIINWLEIDSNKDFIFFIHVWLQCNSNRFLSFFFCLNNARTVIYYIEFGWRNKKKMLCQTFPFHFTYESYAIQTGNNNNNHFIGWCNPFNNHLSFVILQNCVLSKIGFDLHLLTFSPRNRKRKRATSEKLLKK